VIRHTCRLCRDDLEPFYERSSAVHPSVTPSTSDTVGELLQFGATMLGAGNTATRTRQSMEAIARKLGIDALSVSISFDSITATVRRSDEWITRVGTSGQLQSTSGQVAELEWLPGTLKAETTSGEIATELADIV
jgi:uncharacterized membrane protein YjjP (DUF1212 family)